MFNFIKVQVDGVKTVVKSNTSILEVTKLFGAQVPRFCYYQGLSISGNCRMCLVELKNAEKLVLSCSTQVEPNIEIITHSLDIKKARENVLELLLINHPLDCPICDQGGECDLQENTLGFGSFSSKVNKVKRGIEDSSFNFLIKTVMTRCIHCTRCVRFADEIAYSSMLGTLNRGDSTEIGGYLTKNFDSEISGSIVDLCPVGSIISFKKIKLKKLPQGALTNKREAFKTRPWEFKAIETIDLTDSFSSSILVNVKETQIYRVLPRSDKFLTSNLISNRARFSYDSLKNNRSYDTLVALENNFILKDWNQTLKQFSASVVLNKNLVLIINQRLNLLVLNKLKFLSHLQKNIKIVSLMSLDARINIYYCFYNSLVNFSSQVCNFFLIGLNVSSEIPALGARVKSTLSNLNSNLYILGNKNVLSFVNQSFNLNAIDFLKVYEGKKNVFSSLLSKTAHSYVFVGESFQKRCSSLDIFFYFGKENNCNLIICYSSPNSESNRLINLKSITLKDFNLSTLIFFIDISDTVMSRRLVKLIKRTKIWFSSHFSFIYKQSFLMVPTASNYFEQLGVYINLEKIPRISHKIMNTLTESKSILSTVNYFLPKLNKKFSYLIFINENLKKSFHFSSSFFKLFGSKSLFVKSQSIVISRHALKINEKESIDTFQKNSYNLNVSLLRQRVK